MRQRRIKNLEEKLEDLSAYAVEDAEEMRGNWRSLFPALTESGEADKEASGRLFAEF